MLVLHDIDYSNLKPLGLRLFRAMCSVRRSRRR